MRYLAENPKAERSDEIWLLSHKPVYTQGQAGKSEHVLNPGKIPVVQIDRGGQVTYHGPGQLVAYLLINVRRRTLGVRTLVEMIESGKIHSEEVEHLLQSYIQPMIEQGADHLVLGCTHYPFLTPILTRILPQHVEIVDCSGAVAKQVERVLKKEQLLCGLQHVGNATYFCTGDSHTMRQFVSPEEVNTLSIP